MHVGGAGSPRRARGISYKASDRTYNRARERIANVFNGNAPQLCPRAADSQISASGRCAMVAWLIHRDPLRAAMANNGRVIGTPRAV